MRGDGWITVVERGYSLEGSEAEWLRSLVEAAVPILDAGLGALGCVFEPGVQRAPSTLVALDSALAAYPRMELGASLILGAILRDEELGLVHRAERTFATVSELFGGADAARSLPYFSPRWIQTQIAEHRQWGDAITALACTAQPSSEWGLVDVARALGINPEGPSVVLFGPLARFARTDAGAARRWSRIMVHLAAGLRLRRRVARLTSDGDAVISLDGRVHHAEGEATRRPLREALREAAVRVDRARGALRRTDPDQGLDTWTGLVEGRWSLVDRFDRDGRHYLVARRNDPQLTEQVALTPRERAVVAYAGVGWSNKRIAYALGVSMSTVSTLLSRAAAKLRLDRVGVSTALGDPDEDAQGGRHAWLDEDVAVLSIERGEPILDALSPSEREVARLVVNGLSNAQVAAARSTAIRTVANQLASIYRKLGVGSRAELASRLRRASA